MMCSYAAEIAQIMHGLGDGSKANPESAHLIEEIVGQQMNSLLRQAYEVSLTRSSNSIGLQEILFLMRKDKVKLVRLLKHLSFKDSLSSTMSSVSGTIPPTASSPFPPSQSSSSSGSVSGGRGFVDLGSLAAASHGNQMPVTMTISGNSGLSSASSSSSCSSVGSNLVSSTSCVPASLVHHVVVSDHASHQHQVPFGNQQQHQDDASFHPPSSSGSSEQTTGTASGGSVATTVSHPPAHAGNAAMQHVHQHTHHHHQEEQRQHLHQLQQQPTKRLKICMDFLRSTLDQSGQLIRAFSDEFFDEIKHKRALRREKMTRYMTDQEYMRFHQSRQVSFVSKSRPNKFREWLSLKSRTDDCLPPHVVINDFAIEVLQYLAYETVAEIVDLCLLVKQDSRKEACDPVHNLVRDVRQPGVLRRSSSYDVTMDESPHKRRRQNDGPDEVVSDCIQPINVREVARRFLTPSGIFTMGQRSQLVQKPFLKRLIAL